MENLVCKSWSVAEETYGFATTVYGVCAKNHRSHVFRVEADLIGGGIRKQFHGNCKAKLYSINYKLAAAIQMMGNGNTDVATLAGFLELPASWSSISRHMQMAEEVMGPVQIKKREESEVDALREEVEAHRENNDLLLHECKIVDHEHPPLPMIKGSYGN